MIKREVKIVKKRGVNYLYKGGRKIKYKPWLGDMFSFLYDFIMAGSIFPKKFEASIDKHEHFLKNEFRSMHNKNVLELATGSGNMAEILPSDNLYTGIDISEGLLKMAHKKFVKRGFNNFELYVCNAEELPFEDKLYDLCICNLSLNFFSNLKSVIEEIKRVLKKRGAFICSVPVPERNQNQSVIRGNLYSEKELEDIFAKNGFSFSSSDFKNGTLLYFKAFLD